MGMEIERKFLVEIVPEDLMNYPCFEIAQGYLDVRNFEDELRVRRKGKEYFLTFKSGEGLERDEFEVEITAETFQGIWPLTEFKRVEKTRYEIPCGFLKIDLDIYKGRLEGLATAEIEFDSIRASRTFYVPEWFGKEITYDDRYKNKNLAIHGYPKQ